MSHLKHKQGESSGNFLVLCSKLLHLVLHLVLAGKVDLLRVVHAPKAAAAAAAHAMAGKAPFQRR